ncbi:MAG: hypothetical protein WCL61_03125 [bacterium]
MKLTKKYGSSRVDAVLADIGLGVSNRPVTPLKNGDWYEQGGVIYFKVVSDGTTGEEWIKRLEVDGRVLTEEVKKLLCSPKFQPTSGVETKVSMIRGSMFSDEERVCGMVYYQAEKRNLSKLNPEIACLICEKFPNEENMKMDIFWIVVMHDPIKLDDGQSYVLCVSHDDNIRQLRTRIVNPTRRWGSSHGFAFGDCPK